MDFATKEKAFWGGSEGRGDPWSVDGAIPFCCCSVQFSSVGSFGDDDDDDDDDDAMLYASLKPPIGRWKYLRFSAGELYHVHEGSLWLFVVVVV